MAEPKQKIIREKVQIPKTPIVNSLPTPKPTTQVNKPVITPPKPPTPAAKTKTPPKPVAAKPKPKSNTVHDKNLITSLLYMKENSLMPENHANPHFDSVKEAEDYSIEEINSAIKDSINSIKEDISDLQKKGHNLHLESIRLLEIPLKVRVWESNHLRKDLEAIYSIILPIKTKTKTLVKEEEEKLKEKERLEKLKEQEELKPKTKDPNKIEPIPKFIKKKKEEQESIKKPIPQKTPQVKKPTLQKALPVKKVTKK